MKRRLELWVCISVSIALGACGDTVPPDCAAEATVEQVAWQFFAASARDDSGIQLERTDRGVRDPGTGEETVLAFADNTLMLINEFKGLTGSDGRPATDTIKLAVRNIRSTATPEETGAWQCEASATLTTGVANTFPVSYTSALTDSGDHRVSGAFAPPGRQQLTF